jgi:hypothetical protein
MRVHAYASESHYAERRPAKRGETQPFIEAALASRQDECVLWPFATMDGGYPHIRRNGKDVRVHMLVCEQAHGPRPSKRHQTAHSCGVSSCINPRHLRWATKVENEADKIRHGSTNRGERHGMSKITEAVARQAIEMKRSGLPCRIIGAEIGLSKSQVERIVSGQSWGHLQ